MNKPTMYFPILWFARILHNTVSNSFDVSANSLADPSNHVVWIPCDPHILSAHQGKQPTNYKLLQFPWNVSTTTFISVLLNLTPNVEDTYITWIRSYLWHITCLDLWDDWEPKWGGHIEDLSSTADIKAWGIGWSFPTLKIINLSFS